MNSVFLVGLGGAIGVLTRYWIGMQCSFVRFQFINSVLLVNILGAFFIGVVARYLQLYEYPQLKLIFVIGFLGGFTTFSTYILDLLTFIQNQQWVSAIWYFLVSNGLGVLFFILGYYSLKFLK